MENQYCMTYTLPDVQKKLQNLQGRFEGVVKFLKKNTTHKHGKMIPLSSLPWYLLLGPTGAGKTTLLANSNINFILAKQFKRENIKALTPSDHCDWWVTRDLVLVDVPGTYLLSKEKNSSAHLLWEGFLKSLQKFHTKHAVHGIIITLHLPELLKQKNSQQKNQITFDLKHRIAELRTQFGKELPCYLVITKCDLLPGFTDFFSEISSDELAQAWGITLPHIHENEKLTDIFTARFNALIHRLNQQLIPRLHQERDSTVRPYIKDFPLQVERLKEAIVHFISALAIPDLALQGVYLTSSIQEQLNEPTHYLPATHSHHTHQALQLIPTASLPSRAHFVKQLILHGLLANTTHWVPTLQTTGVSWQRRFVYTASFLIILIATFLLGQDFQRGVRQAYAIQNDLAQYQLDLQHSTPQGNRLIKALPLLNALQRAAHQSTYSLSLAEHLLSFYSSKSQQTARQVYSQALQTIVFPELKNYFEKFLQTPSYKNPELVYTVLKAYLMLGNIEYMQNDFLTDTLQTLLLPNSNKEDTRALVSHVSATLNLFQQPLKLNNELIEHVRKQLNMLPKLSLGFIMLKNRNGSNIDNTINLINSPIFISKAVATQVPAFFTSALFQKLSSSEMTAAATEALRGNWVIGNNVTMMADTAAVNALANQLRAQYIANYVDFWESFLANIQLATPKNLAQADNIIATLTSNHSPLLELLQTIKQNTAFAPLMAVSPKLQALNALLANTNNTQTSPLYPIFINLQQLHAYLQSIVNTPDIEGTAFQAAVQRMQDPTQNPLTQLHTLAEQCPEPLNTWLNTLAMQSWHFILQEASSHIENAWHDRIMSIYHSQIADHYPFSQTANQEVNLLQFTTFFGQQGELVSFYRTFLKPFINDTDKQWYWRSVDNQKINFSEKSLEQLQLATRLQKAFFPNGDNKLYVAFSLQPVALDGQTKSVILNINGQELVYQKDSPRTARTLSWPGTNNIGHATTLNFVTPTNQLISNTIKGDWGWFKLVDNTKKNVSSSKEMVLNFDVNGHHAEYLLFTQGNLNPFLLQNLEQFQLPEQL